MSAHGQFIVARPINDVMFVLQNQEPISRVRWTPVGRTSSLYTPTTRFLDATSFETKVRFRWMGIGLGFKVQWSSFAFNGKLEEISPDMTRIHYEAKVNTNSLMWSAAVMLAFAIFIGIVSQSLICPAFMLFFIGISVAVARYQTPHVYKTQINNFLSKVFQEEDSPFAEGAKLKQKFGEF